MQSINIIKYQVSIICGPGGPDWEVWRSIRQPQTLDMGATKPSPSIPKPRLLVSKQELFIFSPCSGSAAPWRHEGRPGAQGWVHESNAPHGWNYVGWGFNPSLKAGSINLWPSVGMSESKYLCKLICLSHQTILNLEYLPQKNTGSPLG